MRKVLWFAALAALAASPAQSATTSSAGAAAGYDWMLGSWACTNTDPSPMGGPAAQTRTAARVAGALFLRVAGKNFERSGYVTYVPATKTWWNPFSYINGNYAAESTTATGKRSVWTGEYVDAATGARIQVRDTYSLLAPTTYTDLGQYRSAGVWKTGYEGTCTKS